MYFLSLAAQLLQGSEYLLFSPIFYHRDKSRYSYPCKLFFFSFLNNTFHLLLFPLPTCSLHSSENNGFKTPKQACFLSGSTLLNSLQYFNEILSLVWHVPSAILSLPLFSTTLSANLPRGLPVFSNCNFL